MCVCVCEYEFYLYRGSMEHVYMQKLCVYHLMYINYAYIIICIYIYYYEFA